MTLATLALLSLIAANSAPVVDPAPAKIDQSVAGGNAMGMSLMRELAQTPGNVFFSPVNIEHALAVTRCGARGQTLEALDRVMGIGAVADRDAQLKNLFSATLYAQNKDPHAFVLMGDARLWYSPDAQLIPASLKAITDYRASGQELSFNDKPAAADRINSWVSDATGKMIPKLVVANDIPNAGLVITSAVYFRGDWKNKFLHMWTEPRDFTTENGATVKVPTMYKIDGMSFAQNDLMQSVRLDYVGDAHMLVVLPRPGKMDEVLRTLDLSAVEGAFKPAQVSLKLPKVDIAMNRSLKPALEKLGLADAFDPALADFTGFTALKPTYISDVRHASALRINEERTEASAATSVELVAGSPGSPDEPIAMTVDRPFLVVIRHTSTGAVLFVGKVADPRG